MSIRESIAKMREGGPPVVVSGDLSQVNYVRNVAKQNGQKLRQEKRTTGEWVLRCIGRYENATSIWLRNIKAKREWWRRNRAKT